MAAKTPADTIREVDQLLQVHEGIVKGKSLTLLAKEMGVSASAIRKLQKDIANTMLDGYHEQIAYSRAQANVRLEHLYGIAVARATGTPLPGSGEEDPFSGVPDRQWMKMAVDIIKAQVALFEADEDWVKKREEEEGKKLDYRNVETITITRTSEMYDHAHEKEWETWADTDLENYLTRNGDEIVVDIPADSDLKEIKDKLNEMDKVFGDENDEEIES